MLVLRWPSSPSLPIAPDPSDACAPEDSAPAHRNLQPPSRCSPRSLTRCRPRPCTSSPRRPPPAAQAATQKVNEYRSQEPLDTSTEHRERAYTPLSTVRWRDPGITLTVLKHFLVACWPRDRVAPMPQDPFAFDQYFSRVSFRELQRSAPEFQTGRRDPSCLSPDGKWLYCSSVDEIASTGDEENLRLVLNVVVEKHRDAAGRRLLVEVHHEGRLPGPVRLP